MTENSLMVTGYTEDYVRLIIPVYVDYSINNTKHKTKLSLENIFIYPLLKKASAVRKLKYYQILHHKFVSSISPHLHNLRLSELHGALMKPSLAPEYKKKIKKEISITTQKLNLKSSFAYDPELVYQLLMKIPIKYIKFKCDELTALKFGVRYKYEVYHFEIDAKGISYLEQVTITEQEMCIVQGMKDMISSTGEGDFSSFLEGWSHRLAEWSKTHGVDEL